MAAEAHRGVLYRHTVDFGRVDVSYGIGVVQELFEYLVAEEVGRVLREYRFVKQIFAGGGIVQQYGVFLASKVGGYCRFVAEIGHRIALEVALFDFDLRTITLGKYLFLHVRHRVGVFHHFVS